MPLEAFQVIVRKHRESRLIPKRSAKESLGKVHILREFRDPRDEGIVAEVVTLTEIAHCKKTRKWPSSIASKPDKPRIWAVSSLSRAKSGDICTRCMKAVEKEGTESWDMLSQLLSSL